MTKDEIRTKLCSVFWAGDVERWLDQFPSEHKFTDTAISDFVDYINSIAG